MKIIGHPRYVVARRFILKFAPHRWGRVKYQSALTFYCQCLAKNEWPSYSFDKNKLMFGLNKIEPQDLWTYKKTAGQGSLDARNEYKQQPAPTPNDGEVIP